MARKKGRPGDISVYPGAHLTGLLYTGAKIQGKKRMSWGVGRSFMKAAKAGFGAAAGFFAAIFRRLKRQSIESAIAKRLRKQPAVLPPSAEDNARLLDKAGGKLSFQKPGVISSKRTKWQGAEPDAVDARLARSKLMVKIGVPTALALLIAMLGSLGMPAMFPDKYNTVIINDEGNTVRLRTRSKTVGELVSSGVLMIGSGDMVLLPDNMELAAVSEVPVKRSMEITVVSGGVEVKVSMMAGTVQDALKEAGIDLGAGDSVAPYPNVVLEPDMRIVHKGQRVEYVTDEQVLPFKEVVIKTSALKKGETKVSKEGSEGIKRTKTKVTYLDNEEIDRQIVDTEITKKAVDREILEGTAVEKPKTATASTTKKTTQTTKKTTNTSTTKKTEKSPTTLKPVQGLDMDRVKSTVVAELTAYTHTGNRTATGTWPKKGTVAVNPKRIPYGTRLYIPGYGYAVAEDTGGFVKTKPHVIDVFFETERECRLWGRRRNVTVYLLK
ncbi:MAG: ubiquitin-like domain-containing protein [Christensenellales bacterium]|jgi:uncharacterized protein YabE (DUF348 family)